MDWYSIPCLSRPYDPAGASLIVIDAAVPVPRTRRRFGYPARGLSTGHSWHNGLSGCRGHERQARRYSRELRGCVRTTGVYERSRSCPWFFKPPVYPAADRWRNRRRTHGGNRLDHARRMVEARGCNRQGVIPVPHPAARRHPERWHGRYSEQFECLRYFCGVRLCVDCGYQSKRKLRAGGARKGRTIFFTSKGRRRYEPRAPQHSVSGLHAAAVPRHAAAASGSFFGQNGGAESRTSRVLRGNRALAHDSFGLATRIGGPVRAAVSRRRFPETDRTACARVARLGADFTSEKIFRIPASEELSHETFVEIQPGAVAGFCRGIGYHVLHLPAAAAAKRKSGNHGKRADHDGGGHRGAHLHRHADQAAARDANEVFLPSAIRAGVLGERLLQPAAKGLSRLRVQGSHPESYQSRESRDGLGGRHYRGIPEGTRQDGDYRGKRHAEW